MNWANKWAPWYSIIAAVMMISFLIVFCSWTLHLVLSEMQDGRWRQEYLKSSAAAEWALELALLEIKKHGYGVYAQKQDIDILGDKKPVMSYEFVSRVQDYSTDMASNDTIIIPLFWIDEGGTLKNPSGSWISFNASDTVLWNIIGDTSGISWKWVFSSSTVWKVSDSDSSSVSLSIESFISWNSGSFLQIYNAWSASQNVSVNFSGSSDYFTLPEATIYSNAKVWKYSQNLKTEVNNTDFLNILRYSIFSN